MDISTNQGDDYAGALRVDFGGGALQTAAGGPGDGSLADLPVRGSNLTYHIQSDDSQGIKTRVRSRKVSSPSTKQTARERYLAARCDPCGGLGLVAAGTVYRDAGDGCVNGEAYGERICPACKGTGKAVQA